MTLEIRLEQPCDYKTVETITREAFWNLYVPGCNEHLILHRFRTSPDFISQLCFVALKNQRIVGNIVYSHAQIQNETGQIHPVITFGPLSVLPDYQGQGIGRALIEYSKQIALQMGFHAIVIYGYPEYYHRLGFQSASQYKIKRSDGEYAKALMALELKTNAFKDISGQFFESPLFETNDTELEIFDAQFPPKEKKETASQKQFEIMANTLETIK